MFAGQLHCSGSAAVAAVPPLIQKLAVGDAVYVTPSMWKDFKVKRSKVKVIHGGLHPTVVIGLTQSSTVAVLLNA